MVVAFFSDRFKHRFLFALIPIAVAIAGFAILITVHDNHHLEYGALFMVTSGTYSAMPGMSEIRAPVSAGTVLPISSAC